MCGLAHAGYFSFNTCTIPFCCEQYMPPLLTLITKIPFQKIFKCNAHFFTICQNIQIPDDIHAYLSLGLSRLCAKGKDKVALRPCGAKTARTHDVHFSHHAQIWIIALQKLEKYGPMCNVQWAKQVISTGIFILKTISSRVARYTWVSLWVMQCFQKAILQFFEIFCGALFSIPPELLVIENLAWASASGAHWVENPARTQASIDKTKSMHIDTHWSGKRKRLDTQK